MSLPFIDTDVLLRTILQDHPDHSPRATALLDRIVTGQASARVTTAVFFEVAFVLLRRPGAQQGGVLNTLETLLAIDGLRFDERRTLSRTIALAREHGVPLIDAYQIASLEARASSTIISFDRHFDRFPGIERVEP